MSNRKTRTDYLMPFLAALCSLPVESWNSLRKYYPKCLKKHKPFRVVNPMGMHTARLHPRQGIKLVQTFPVDNVDENAQLKLTIKSDYLYFEREEKNDKGQNIYYIGQKYDLTTLAEKSEIFLGEIRLDLVGNTHPEKSNCHYEGGTLIVYHCSPNDKLLTLPNPQGHTIKLSADQELDVACFVPSWGRDFTTEERWTHDVENFNMEASGVSVEIMESRSEFTNEPSPLVKPTINPHLPFDKSFKDVIEKELNLRNQLLQENYFKLTFTPESRQHISALKSGSYACSRVTFKGSATVKGEHQTVKREFIVMLSKHGKPTKIKVIDKAEILRNVNDKSKRILRNPGNSEIVDFYPGNKEYTIEIPVPKTFWKEEPLEASWSVVSDDYITANTNKDDLTWTEPGILHRGDVVFQVINVKCISTEATGKFVGAIKLSYPPKQHFGEEANKRISFYFCSSPDQYKKKKTCGDPTKINERYHFKQGLGHYDDKVIKLAKVDIEEIEIKGLADKAHTVKLRPFDNGWWNDGKKKEATTMPLNHIMGPPAIHTTGNQSLKKNGSDQNYTGKCTTSGLTEPIIVYDPAHHAEIEITPDQELILRLSQPDEIVPEVDKEGCHGQLWTVNPLAVAGIKPLVKYNRVLEVGTGTYRQEARISAELNNLPTTSGRHSIGYIRLECSNNIRLIRLYVKKTGNSERQLPKFPSTLDFITKVSKYKANNKNYFFVKNWKNNSCIKLEPTDVLYVANPRIDEWGDGNWSVQLIQRPIPIEIWERLPTVIKDVVDRQNPWYNRDVPRQLKNALCFKPLAETSSKVLNTMLERIGDMVKVDYFPVATLRYESFKETVDTQEVGEIENRQTLRREFNICVALKNKKRGETISIHHPVDKSEIHLKIGDNLLVWLNSIVVDGDDRIRLWECAEYPPNLMQYEGLSHNCNDDCFRFSAKLAGQGWIKFSCGNKSVSQYLMIK